MSETQKKTYNVLELHGLPFIGLAIPIILDPLNTVLDHAQRGADIVSVKVMGQPTLLLNHPDLIRHVLIDNHKNYRKSAPYIRFESAIGLGLLTSNGDKWRRDRQKIQPMFARERIEGYYYEVVNEVSEKYKHRWLRLTEHGSADLNISEEMAKLTTEVILKSIFGRSIDDEAVASLHAAYAVLIDYLKTVRIFPRVDLRRLCLMPSYFRFRRALAYIDRTLAQLAEHYKRGGLTDRRNMLALLVEAQKGDPEHFTAKDIRDHAVSMVFAGFESTSILMQWLWYALDEHAGVAATLREHILDHAPCTATEDSTSLTFDAVQRMEYLNAVVKETMRLYPPFWLTGREPIEDDRFGDFTVKRGTVIALPQISMHRHPRWWKESERFMPERFMGDAGQVIDPGVYFPFSQGPRKCSGYSFVDMEAKTIMAKLVPLFDVVALNKAGNPMRPGISLKLKYPLKVRISRR